MKKLLALVLLAVALTSCNGIALKKEQTNNDEFKVELLFEHDGIKVYRFLDGSRYHYFTNKGETISSQTSGKISYEDNIR